MTGSLRVVSMKILVLLIVVAAGWGVAHAVDPRVSDDDIRAARAQAAHQAGEDFLSLYVEPDGRVIRRDEGGDVVSEGQAYGMLIAVAVGDEDRFRAIWEWTESHLRRADGLLSWRWADGHVTDLNSATDADLDAARSLVLAGNRFDAPELAAEGERLGADILRSETVLVGSSPPPVDTAPAGQWLARPGLVTVAGNWATAAPHIIDPGYFSPRAERELLQASADGRWRDVSRTQRILAWQLVGAGALPPDWATVDTTGRAAPAGPPAGGPIEFGLDAARLPIRFAESCDSADRALAASMRPILAAAGDVPAIRNLDGTPARDWQHPVALVSAAATDSAAGDREAAARRLDQASGLQQRFPTYFGAAWVALGRIMLDTSLLGECP